jgi:hypothetical protein
VKAPGRRRKDDSEGRGQPFNQRDVDGVIVAAANEFLGSIERVDEKKRVAVLWDAAGRDLFFGDDGHPGCEAGQGGKDDELGGAVRFGDGRPVALRFAVEAAPDDLQYGFAGLARGLRKFV